MRADRVMLVVGQLTCGGTEQQLYLLASSLIRRGVDVYVAVSTRNADEPFAARLEAIGADVRRLDDGSATSFLRLRKLARLRSYVSSVQPHVVHSMSFRLNFSSYLATLGTSAIVVGSVRSDFDLCRQQYGRLCGWTNSRWPRLLLFNSLVSADQARKCRGLLSPRRIEFVRNGVELDRVPSVVGRVKTDTEAFHIVGIGSLNPKKRWDRLILAVESLIKQGRCVRLTLVGSGKGREALESLVKSRGLPNPIQFIGRVASSCEVLADADLLVHTADFEGSPNVIMEAMAAGVAVVATDAGDARNLIEHGKTGFVVCRNDAKALVASIAALIDDRETLGLFGRAAREIAEMHFGVETMVDNVMRVYREAGYQAVAQPFAGAVNVATTSNAR